MIRRPPSRVVLSAACLIAAAGLALAGPAAAEAVRVATLLPFVADALADSGPEASVVATVRRAVGEAPPEGVTDLGSAHDPNLELLAEARPDLVVADAVFHAMLAPRLERSLGEVMLLDTSSVGSTFASLQALGDRVGVGAVMKQRIDASQASLEALRLDEKAQALVLFGTPGSFFVMTGKAWLGDLMTRLGFELVGTRAGSERMPGFVAVSDELLVTLRPRYVFLISHGDPERIRSAFQKKLEGDGPWSQLGKNAAGVHALDPDTFGANPGLGMGEAAAKLLELTTPEAARHEGPADLGG